MKTMVAVVIDTDVFSALYVTPASKARERFPLDGWKALLEGARVVIYFQTRAELLTGARSGGWGARRLDALISHVSATPVIGLDEDVLQSYVELTTGCKVAGHGLHAKVHTADRWIAACAVAKQLPLLSGDEIFVDAPGIALLGKP